MVFFFQIASTKGEVTNVIVSDLKTDTSYNFRITARNSVGTGSPYTAEEVIIAGKQPSKFTFFKCLSLLSAYILHILNY